MAKVSCYCPVTEQLVSVSATEMAVAYSLAKQALCRAHRNKFLLCLGGNSPKPVLTTTHILSEHSLTSLFLPDCTLSLPLRWQYLHQRGHSRNTSSGVNSAGWFKWTALLYTSKRRVQHVPTLICARLSSARGATAAPTSWCGRCLNQCLPSRREGSVRSLLPSWGSGALSFPGSASSCCVSGSCSTQHMAQNIQGQKKQKRPNLLLTQAQDSLLWRDPLTAMQLSPSCCPLPLYRAPKGQYSYPSSILTRSDIFPFFITIGEAEMDNTFHSFSAWVGLEKIHSLCSVWWGSLGGGNQVFMVPPFFCPPNELCLVSTWKRGKLILRRVKLRDRGRKHLSEKNAEDLCSNIHRVNVARYEAPFFWRELCSVGIFTGNSPSRPQSVDHFPVTQGAWSAWEVLRMMTFRAMIFHELCF